MTYTEALTLIKTEFETRKVAPHCEIIKTNRTLNGYNSFSINLYQGFDKVILSDLGATKDVFDEVEEEEWRELCASFGFEFKRWKIVRDFSGLDDVYDFIEFLNFIADRFDPLDEDDEN